MGAKSGTMSMSIKTLRIAALLVLLSLGVGSLVPNIAAAETSCHEAIAKLFPEGFPIPDQATRGEESKTTVKVYVEGLTLTELKEFFGEELRSRGYRVLPPRNAEQDDTLLEAEEEGWDLIILPSGKSLSAETQGLYLRRRGEDVWFELTLGIMNMR